MKAIILYVSVGTRIVVPDEMNIDNLTGEDYELLANKSKSRLINNLKTSGMGDILESIEEDTQMPFGSDNEDEYYQPDLFDEDVLSKLASHHVFASKENAQKAFPGVEIHTFHGDDIEDPLFVDEDFK